MSSELEVTIEEESRAQWANKTEEIKKDTLSEASDEDEVEEQAPLVDFDDEETQE